MIHRIDFAAAHETVHRNRLAVFGLQCCQLVGSQWKKTSFRKFVARYDLLGLKCAVDRADLQLSNSLAAFVVELIERDLRLSAHSRERFHRHLQLTNLQETFPGSAGRHRTTSRWLKMTLRECAARL